MIPKIIHYCWFGKKDKPESVKKCITSWRKYCPDYEIKCWDESNFDVSQNNYTQKTFALKKYAYLTDFARLKILYENGGIYFDTDVELIKPIDNIVNKGPFMALEQKGRINTGLGVAAEKGNSFIYKNMNYYLKHDFEASGVFQTEICVKITTKLLVDEGFNYKKNSLQNVDGMYVYPTDFFSPIKLGTSKLSLTRNTVAIHHYNASWYVGNKLLRKVNYSLIPLKQFIKFKIMGMKPYE